MCFCASGSFIASGVLVAVGVGTLSVARRNDRMIAALPLFFSVQQAIEGVQWMVPHPSVSSIVFGYCYLFFALVLWPFYVPFMVYHAERDLKRRHLLRWFVGIGGLLSSVMLWYLFVTPIDVQIRPLGILYLIDVPFIWLAVLFYGIVTCGSLIVSSRGTLKRFGIVALLSAFLAAAIYLQTFISVWCFFAAVLSVFVYFVVARKEKVESAR